RPGGAGCHGPGARARGGRRAQRDRSRQLPGLAALPRLSSHMSHLQLAARRAARGCLAPLAALALALATPVSAGPVRVIATDARRGTRQVTVAAWSLSEPGRDGRARIRPLDGAHELGAPGRPTLPAYAATLALPLDGEPTARVVASVGEQAREGTRLEVAGRP